MINTRERVAKIVVDHLAVDAEKVTDDAVLIDDLGADSLDLVELEMALEEEFDFRMPDPSLFTVEMTVADAVRIIDQLRGA